MSGPYAMEYKVAIPRLKQPEITRDAMKLKQRIGRACTTCQSQKVKCTGDKPRCKRCETIGIDCTYVMHRRDKLQMHAYSVGEEDPHTDESRVKKQRQEMAALLKTMRSYATAEDRIKIARLLETARGPPLKKEEEDERIDSHRESSPRHNQGTGASPFGHSHADQHGMGCLDFLDENLHADDHTRKIGFIGMSSGVRWLREFAEVRARTLLPKVESLSLETDRIVLPSLQSSSFCYWANGGSEGDDIGTAEIDLQTLPPFEIAQELLACYMLDVDDSFPILSCKNFERQFRKYYAALHQGNAPKLSPKWQANLNLVFAIGTIKLLRSTGNSCIEDRSHRVYQARAIALNLQSADVTGPVDVPSIQGYGLLAFYCLCAGQINRAWMIGGIALRSAISLGLHLRNEDPGATETKRERLVRIWWSLCSLEYLLSSITGRPSTIAHLHCTVPLPTSEAEERILQRSGSGKRHREHSHMRDAFEVLEARPGLYFQAAVRLSIITQDILVTLYSAAAATKLPEQMQQDMAQLHHCLEQWLVRLPARLNYWSPTNTTSDPFARERILLGSQLSYARMLLTQPCLNALVQGRIPTSEHEAIFSQRMSIACLNAARATVDFLPNEPCSAFIYDRHAWWCVIHHLMQAASVLLLALLCSFPGWDKSLPLYYLNKIVLWLQAMDDEVAHQAKQILVGLLGSWGGRNLTDNSFNLTVRSFQSSGI